jgi:hypothetical protein
MSDSHLGNRKLYGGVPATGERVVLECMFSGRVIVLAFCQYCDHSLLQISFIVIFHLQARK